MDIPALSVISSQNKIQSAVGIQLLKKTMDFTEANSSNLLSMMIPASPTLGTKVDINA